MANAHFYTPCKKCETCRNYEIKCNKCTHRRDYTVLLKEPHKDYYEKK